MNFNGCFKNEKYIREITCRHIVIISNISYTCKFSVIFYLKNQVVLLGFCYTYKYLVSSKDKGFKSM